MADTSRAGFAVPAKSHPSELQNSQIPALAGVSPQEALPGFATALDNDAMKGYLQAALFGTDHPSYTVERCAHTGPLYIPGECCVVRYRLKARSSRSGEILKPLVIGRVFPNRSACALYMRDKLAPLAARMRNRPEVAAFAALAATIEPLNMVVHVWPIDTGLPSLVDVTDRQRMIEIFRKILPETLGRPFVVDDCAVELVSYRRRQGCVLRYTIVGKTPDRDKSQHLTVYGKVAAHGNEALNSRIIDALRDRILQRGAVHRFTIPRSFGCRPELQLSLLEALPGQAKIGPALEARLAGHPPPPDALPLEEMVATCGYVAATVHTSGIQLGRARTFGDVVADLLREIALTRQFVPDFGDRAQSWLERIAGSADASELPLCLSHGDFKYEQLLFDGTSSGLVDFDTICQAEPALDLGKFLAHLRVQTQPAHMRASVISTLGEELVEQFLRAYVGATGDQLGDERQLRRRTTVYERLFLLRGALRSQQKLNKTRLEITTALLDEQMS